MIKLTEQFVPVKINVEKDTATAKKFKVRGLPTIIFVTAKGKRVDKIVGYLPPEQFAAKLQDVLTIHHELAAIKAKFDADPSDLANGGKLGAAYASRGKPSLAKRIIRKLEAADPTNEQGHLTNAYLALGEYYLDEEEQPNIAIRWYAKAEDRGHDPSAVAEARYRIGLAYYYSRTKHTPKAKKFGEKLRSAGEAIDTLLAMSDIPEELRLQAADLAESVKQELTEHEKLRNKG